MTTNGLPDTVETVAEPAADVLEFVFVIAAAVAAAGAGAAVAVAVWGRAAKYARTAKAAIDLWSSAKFPSATFRSLLFLVDSLEPEFVRVY